ncbi:hypothetical protein PP301_gp047 [Gordonia phage GMA2]|uniref:Uncharacterized protein n=1 Tax=Gordonia phage GMA2 TaxID=1647283 RepID=A0A0K0N6X3_9CAUD|nr:hypothetical protein PP301_gp047 [Gordonia phage GMA2]AKJ72585.1 hypothetical protein GMA2_47 [Gordonia phage GMA2]
MGKSASGYAKADLLEALDTAITQYDSAVKEQRKKWAEDHLEEWRAFRDAITKALKNKTPITEETLNTAMGRQRGRRVWLSDLFYSPDVHLGRYYSSRSRRSVTITIEDLRSLQQALRAWSGDTVTDTTLSRMGYPGSVAVIFNAAQGLHDTRQ